MTMKNDTLGYIPKVVLHEHIEGSITPRIAQQLAKKYDVEIPAYYLDDSQDNFYFDKNDFTSFITLYDFIASLVKDEEDYYLVVKDYLIRNAELGLFYCELIASPLHMAGDKNENIDLVKYKRCMQAINQAVDEVKECTGLVTKLHAVGVRHLGLPHIASIVTLINDNPDDLMVGLNIAGDERQGDFADIATVTAHCSLQKSFHAGEICGAESISQALDAGAVRIGHGISAINDEALIQRLIASNVTLEISLSSNLFLIEKYRNNAQQHPIKQLYDAGVRICINTDDAGIFNTDISHEYQMASGVYGFENYELLDISLCAIEAAFISKDYKSKLKSSIYNAFRLEDVVKMRNAISSQTNREILNKRLAYRYEEINGLTINSSNN